MRILAGITVLIGFLSIALRQSTLAVSPDEPDSGLSHDIQSQTTPGSAESANGKNPTTNSKGDKVEKTNVNELIRITVEEPRESVFISDAVPFYVTVTNLSSSVVTVHDIRLNLPPSLTATRLRVNLAGALSVPDPPPQSRRSEEQEPTKSEVTPSSGPIERAKKLWLWVDRREGSAEIPKGGVGRYQVVLCSAEHTGATILTNLRLLAFKPTDLEISIVVQHTIPGGSDGTGLDTTTVESKVRVRFIPSPVSFVLGGLIGSFAIALFHALYVFLKWIRAEGKRVICGGQGVFKTIWKGKGVGAYHVFLILLSTLTGALTAIVALILTHNNRDSSMPINFVVNDFVGAVILGLLSPSLISWVWKTVSKIKVFG